MCLWSPDGVAELTRGRVFVEGEVSSSNKELIALGVAIACGCEASITCQIPSALRAGASTKEVEEAIAVAAFVGGERSALYGAMALQALRQFDAHPKEWAMSGELPRAEQDSEVSIIGSKKQTNSSLLH